MLATLTDFFAILGLLSLLSIILTLIWWYLNVRPAPVPKKAILELDLNRTIVETIPEERGAQALMRKATSVLSIVDALKHAETNERVIGLLIRGGGPAIGYGMAQELREAVTSFRKTGKRAVFFAETFGEAGIGNRGYYLATACDQIYLQPSGDVGLVGPSKQTPFLKGMLEKLGVEPHLDHRHEYKNMLNLFTEDGYTEPHRVADEQLMASLFETLVQDIAVARGWGVAETHDLMERGPYLASEALEHGLVDGLLYRDEVFDTMREELGDDAELFFVDRYQKRVGSTFKKGDEVAVIFGTGPIQRGESRFNPMNMNTTMGSETVSAAFRAAIDDEVKAILFRIDSPGGSYVASDTIWREVDRARKANIPVVVSMSNVAGSGGYFVAAPATRIVAHPMTLTGSIGVVGGKMVTRDLWDKLGVSWEELHTTESATMWSTLRPYTDHTKERRDAMLDHVYEDFTSKVAEARGLSSEQIDAVARGRIWTGRDAHERGLVDALGGLDVALGLLREECELAPDADLKLKRYPVPKPLIKRLRGPKSSEREAGAYTLDTGLAHLLKPILPLLTRTRLLNADGRLRMPDVL